MGKLAEKDIKLLHVKFGSMWIVGTRKILVLLFIVIAAQIHRDFPTKTSNILRQEDIAEMLRQAFDSIFCNLGF